jgi:hypothetical protein
MTSSRSALRQLRAIRNTYGIAAERIKRAQLQQVRAITLTTVAQVQALNEDLLFICAFPGSVATRSLARQMLDQMSVRLHGLPRRQQRAADDSGIAGSTTRHVFPWPLMRWLVDVAIDDVAIDWRILDDPSKLDTMLGLLLHGAEREAFESGEFTSRDWIRLARPAARGPDVAWLAAGRSAAPGVARWLEAEWDRAEVPLAWQLGDSRWSTTRNVLAPTALACRTGMRRPPGDALTEIARPMPAIERLARPRARRVIEVARAALAARTREVNAITYPNVDEVYWCDLGEGAALAVIGIAREQRLTLETNTGFLLLANGIPIGYGGVTPLFRQANTGINIFDAFRGSEAAFLWTQALRTFHTLFGVGRFVINGYQFGAGNAEAIRSGAFWFYYRLGFRPGAAATRRLAAREATRMAAEKSYRSSPRTLRELATGDLFLDIPGYEPADFFDESLLPHAGVIAAQQLAREPVWSRDEASRRITAAVAHHLDVGDWSRWTAAERQGFGLLAPLVAGLPDWRDWTGAERAALAGMMRAKGSPHERDFALAAAAMPRFFRGIANASRLAAARANR